MLDAKLFREKSPEVKKALEARGAATEVVDDFLVRDEVWRKVLQEMENLRAKQKSFSKGKPTPEQLSELKKLSEEVKALEGKADEARLHAEEILKVIPNLPDDSVPRGREAADNVEAKKWGEITKFSFAPKAHYDVAEKLGILNFDQGTKVAGTRFVVYRGAGARLERALIQFMLDLHTEKNGYTEIFPPLMVNEKAMYGTGQLPKFKEDLFAVSDGYYLIPTAEVPVTNLHMDEILDGAKLPIKYAAYTPCFRREAGAYGKDTRGIIRQHQFNKVELVQFVKPEDSMATLETLTADAEKVLELLKLPYRRMALCSGDMGFSSAKTYDLEVWFPSENNYREISSCSNFKDFQARRAAIRFRRDSQAKPEFVHTLNGSGIAVGRCFAAIMENYQNADGSVTIPEVLIPYMGGLKTISDKI
jgi:seryl-tRNA synthetase